MYWVHTGFIWVPKAFSFQLSAQRSTFRGSVGARYTEDRHRADRVTDRVVERVVDRADRAHRVERLPAAQMTPLACSGCSCRGRTPFKIFKVGFNFVMKWIETEAMR